jgi:hypothetical protein
MKQFTLKISLVFSILIVMTVHSLRAQSNQYLDFDGVDDYVSVTNGSTVIAGSSSMSITGWFYDNSLSYGKGMIGYRAAAGEFYLLELNNGSVECRFKNSAGTTYDVTPVNFTIVPQQWQHFAMVYGTNSLKLYVNGNLVGSKAAAGTITNTAIEFTIGKSLLSGFNFVYSGRIDEVSVWNKELSQGEIQGMITNELVGNEPNLQMYYKFNQGVPGGNNTGITSLHTEINSPLYDGTFNYFALTGATSNFNGTLNSSFQAISFPQIPTQLTTSPPYALNATATSGLPVTYTLLSGPANIINDSVYFTGAGTVSIQADQYGNATFDTATSIINTFDVVDPNLNAPVIDARNPLASADIYMPTLGTLELAAVATIAYPGLFSVQNLEFVINGTTYPAQDYSNSHYTAWWTPSAYGAYTIQINSTSNYGAVSSVNVNVNVIQTVTSLLNQQAFTGIWLNSNVPSVTVDGLLPSYVGAFDTIIATLSVTCPTGGCGPWDRVASIDAQGQDGQWFEIIRYITPYGVPCTHRINLADYMSILQGKVTFRANCATLDNGFLYELKFDFKDGPPPHKYSRVTKVWKTIYPFGDYSNLQPVPTWNYVYPSLAVASKLKLVSTGHGWGNLNTGNAAEFYDATHNIWVNGANTFSQHNWTTCNPNPDACSPQNGTWTYNRAGWCPGSIARPFDYDMTPFVAGSNISLQYVFYSTYVDLCHPNNPNCVNGTTCTDCNDNFNPTLDVNCNLITFFDDASTLSINEVNKNNFVIYPNPSNGMFNLGSIKNDGKNYSVSVFDVVGNSVQQFHWDGNRVVLDLSTSPKGIYVVKISNEKETEVKKLIVQ